MNVKTYLLHEIGKSLTCAFIIMIEKFIHTLITLYACVSSFTCAVSKTFTIHIFRPLAVTFTFWNNPIKLITYVLHIKVLHIEITKAMFV